jgi:dTMP kinase
MGGVFNMDNEIRGLGTSKDYKGRLFVVEGCDGSGKSTQIYLLKKWLETQGFYVYFTEWNSSELIKSATKAAKKQTKLTPTTFSLIHASDFADRYEKLILPHLRAGYIVLCDRYIYTAYARDLARGCNPDWVESLYDYAVKPTVAFYFRAPLEVSVSRILNGRPELKYYEAGMDLGLSPSREESFKIFQGLIKNTYDELAKVGVFEVIDATKPIHEQQKKIKKIVRKYLEDYKPPVTRDDFN